MVASCSVLDLKGYDHLFAEPLQKIGPTFENTSQQDISICSLFGGILAPYLDLDNVQFEDIKEDHTL